MATQPDSSLAAATLPAPLHQALLHVYAQGIAECMLVGGTALAGYYAAHRKSDDLDLFAKDRSATTAATLAVESLAELGAQIHELQHTQQFYSASCRLRDHGFTVQVVLDANLFAVGDSVVASDGVHVADLATILKMKAATLMSRCSEKDLYDLLWLFGRFPKLDARDLVALGAEIDGGMSAESVLISLAGAPLELTSCGFSLSESAEEVLVQVESLKERLGRAFEKVAQNRPPPAVGELIRRLRG